MPARSPLLLAVLAALALAAPAVAAPPVTITPDLINTDGKVSPPSGPAVHTFTDEYDAFGLRLSDGGVQTALFDDDNTTAVVLAWSGVGETGNADLLAPVQARIVIPGTGGVPASTSRVA